MQKISKRLWILVAIPIAIILKDILKEVLKVPRIDPSFTGYAFPSGHVIFVTVTLFALYFLFYEWIKEDNLCKISTFLFIILTIWVISLWRINIGAHTWWECLGGFILGFIVFYLTKVVINKWALKPQDS